MIQHYNGDPSVPRLYLFTGPVYYGFQLRLGQQRVLSLTYKPREYREAGW